MSKLYPGLAFEMPSLKTLGPKAKVASLALVMLMCACSTQPSYQQQSQQSQEADRAFTEAKAMINAGQQKEGMLLVQQLIDSNPDKLQFRAYYKYQQDIQLAARLREADQLRQQQRWAEAQARYQEILQDNPQNQRAQDGLAQLALAQKYSGMLASANARLAKNDLDGAQAITRDLLAEDSANPQALALYEEIERKRMNSEAATPQLKAAMRKPITLEFKDVPIKSLFELITRISNINFVFDQEFPQDKRVSIFVKNTSIEDAIKIILTTNQLEKKVLNDNTLLVYTNSRSKEYQEQFVRSFYLGNTDAKKIMNMIKTVMRTKDIYIDEKLNTLVMRDTPEAIHTVEKLIASQDIAEPEVMLEVEVMEINRRSLEAIGIRYPTQIGIGVQGRRDNGDGTFTNTPGQLSLTELRNFNSGLGVFTITDPVLALNLLHQDTDTNLLANPHIRVKNREKAKVHIGDRIPIITSIANATGFVSESVSYIEVGIKLNVEPTVLLHDQVSIKVGLEVSNQTDSVRSSSGTLTYTIGTRNAETTLRLKDGETQVLAGLFRDDTQKVTNKVPGLSNLPLIGRLFNDRTDDKRKKEIVLLITPRILSNIRPPDAVYTSFSSGIDSSSQGGAGKSSSRPQESVSSTVAPVQSAEDQQKQRAQNDKSFADSVIMQPVNEVANPANVPARP